jgi:hypothetical protein
MAKSQAMGWVVGSYLVLFLGGAALGVGLARHLAPGSFGAEIVGFFALPAAFALGLQLWFGVALLSVLGRFRGARPLREPARPIPGGFVFLPVSSLAGTAAGVLTGVLSSGGFLRAAGAWWLAGTLHGLLAWRLAVSGYLMPPEEL